MAVALAADRSSDPILEARDLYRFYHTGDDETFALRGVSISIAAGEVVAVVGPSGSGKSTLLACLAGLDEPDGGYVSVMGTRITRRPEAERAALRARWIGVLQQSGNLLDHLSVRDNIRAAQALAGDDRPSAPATCLLADVGLTGRERARPATLSGGEAARAGSGRRAGERPAPAARRRTDRRGGRSERTHPAGSAAGPCWVRPRGRRRHPQHAGGR